MTAPSLPGGTERVFLDCGQVYETLHVFLNGREVGCRLAPPYRLEVTSCLQKGENRPRLDIVNTLAKAIPDPLSAGALQELSGCWGRCGCTRWRNRME